MKLVTGGECFCCCKRGPPVKHYMGIFTGLKANEEECLATCSSNPKIYAGFMHCQTDGRNCSVLSNAELAAKIAYYRKEYNKIAWLEVSLDILRESNAN